MNKKLTYLIFLFVLSACTTQPVMRIAFKPTATPPPPTHTPIPTPTLIVPEFINHPSPELTVYPLVYDTSKCLGSDFYYRPDVCDSQEDVSPLAQYCDWIEPPYEELGGLAPAYPIAFCSGVADIEEWAVEPLPDGVTIPKVRPYEAIRFGSGLIPTLFVRFVIERNGEYELMATQEDFQQVYAPIDSPEEALSYAIALTGEEALYGLAYNPTLEYFVPTIEDTHIESVKDGYYVYLFKKWDFSCGPHYHRSAVYMVTYDGELRRKSPYRQLFIDPTNQGCFD